MTKKIISQCAICILSASTVLHAIDWSSAVTDGDWSESTSWTGGVVPTASDDVTIKTLGANVTVSTAVSTNKLINGHNSTITVSTGGTLTVATDAEVGNTGNSANNNAEGTLVVDGGSVAITGKLFLGRYNDTRKGTVTLNSGDISVGSSSTSNGITVQIGGNNLGTGVVNMTGGNFSANGQFRVGQAGAGTMNLSGGNLNLTAGEWQNLRVGASTAAGTLNMTGGAVETKGLVLGNNNVTGNSNFNLDGGTLTVLGGAISLKSDSVLAISDGLFQWEGARVNALGGFITSGNITFATTTVSDDYSGITPEGSWTSTDGTTTLYADTDEVRSGYTTVWASSNDADNDGLADGVETNTGTFLSASNTGTDPNDPDTDDDGLADGVETNTGTFVSASDTGTDPHVADTDSDGLSDGAETGTGAFVDATNTGTDPHLPDTDSDGLSDFVETGLDPTSNSQAAIDLLPSTGGGVAQSVYDAVVTELANAREARAGSTVIDVANDLADITLRVEQTSDVSDWSSATTSDHTIQLSAPAGASFYRFTIPE
jgi:hypothetical protein